jgi:hypothetical protein
MLQRSIGAHQSLPLPVPDISSKTMEYETTIASVLLQLHQALTVLRSAPELLLAQGTNAQISHGWLAPSTRIAEEAMHRLREFSVTDNRLVTELSQNLTILVLAADMLAKGQLSQADINECYELLRRNTHQAEKTLHELQAYVLGEESA